MCQSLVRAGSQLYVDFFVGIALGLTLGISCRYSAESSFSDEMVHSFNRRLSFDGIRGVTFLPNPTPQPDEFPISRSRETNGLTRRDVSESLLPGSVPDLELHPLPEDLGRLDLEINPE